MVEQCIEFGQQDPGLKYKALNRHRIGGPLLDSAYEDTAAQFNRLWTEQSSMVEHWLQMGGAM